MKVRKRYHRLTIWNKIAFWGSITGIVAFIFTILRLSDPSPYDPILNVTIDSIEFFDGPYDWHQVQNRIYRDVLPTSVQYIFYRIDYTYSSPPKETSMVLRAILLNANQEPACDKSAQIKLFENQNHGSYIFGCNYSNDGKWSKGKYTVTIDVDGMELAKANFFIQ